MESIVTPLVKNKGADLTDKNNYRVIPVSNADTKILERIVLIAWINISLVLNGVILLRYVLESLRRL